MKIIIGIVIGIILCIVFAFLWAMKQFADAFDTFSDYELECYKDSNMGCPYTRESCDKLDTSDMSKIECDQCGHKNEEICNTCNNLLPKV